MIDIFKKISDEISNKLNCNRFGNCIHFSELFTEKVAHTNHELLEEFYVIEGYVKIGYETLEHTWIETENGEKIDPTKEQFGKFEYLDKIANKYTGFEYYVIMRGDQRYREEREQYPHKVFKYVESYKVFEKRRNHEIDYRKSKDDIPDIYDGYVYLISDKEVNKEDLMGIEKLKTSLSNRPDAMGEGEYIYQIKTEKPLKKDLQYATWLDSFLGEPEEDGENSFSGKIEREEITQNIIARIKTSDIKEFRLISGFKIYDREVPNKYNKELSEEADSFLHSYIGGTILHKKLTPEIEKELSNFKPNKPIKLYKGIEQIQLEHFSDLENYEVGEKFNFKYGFHSSWTSNFLIAKRFIDELPSTTPFVIESTIDPKDILVDTRLIPEQYYHTDQREVIVKKGALINCKIIWKGL